MAEVMMVRVASVRGSTPREVGARMIVGGDTSMGTIGGGRLEYDAIAHARRLLQNDAQSDTKVVHLGPEIGQCCGGKVELEFHIMSDRPAGHPEVRPTVFIFGGGHVGRALAVAFSPLPVHVQLVDTRSDYLINLPKGVETHELAVPEAAVRTAPPGTAFIVMTHDHTLDFLIVEEALGRKDATYVGMIGSKTKRAVLETQLSKAGIDPAPLICPVGQAGLGDKRPEVIAAFVVAEVLLKFGAR